MNLKTGNPMTGVTAADLVIKEDGKDREIVKVEPATGPVSVVLLPTPRHVHDLREGA